MNCPFCNTDHPMYKPCNFFKFLPILLLTCPHCNIEYRVKEFKKHRGETFCDRCGKVIPKGEEHTQLTRISPEKSATITVVNDLCKSCLIETDLLPLTVLRNRS